MITEGNIQLSYIRKYTDIVEGNLLDVGCGFGHVVKSANDHGYFSVGIDLNPKQFGVKGNLIVSAGEFLPFRDNCFDVGSAISFLEHVGSRKNAYECAREMLRVLKSHGKLYIYSPNFAFPYEHHYKFPFVPMPKKFAVFYFWLTQPLWRRTKGTPRDHHYVLSLNYTTHLELRALFRILGAKVTNITSKPPTKRHQIIRLIRWLIAYFGFSYGIYLLVEKV
ncbi:MAG: class I SAM-dependent methyltransferase [archaeon]|nr:class I SAM-dependent methyltransferase [archaeon]